MNATHSRESPGTRADSLAAEGYTLKRTDQLGVYLLTRPDGLRTYRVNVANNHCNCHAPVTCKHILYCQWFYSYDMAKEELRESRRRDVLVAECEAAAYAAHWHLRRVVAGAAAERLTA